MYVALHVPCHVKVDDVSNAFDIQPASCNISCNQNAALLSYEFLQGHITLTLLFVAVDST